MAKVINKIRGIKTVGELIEALNTYPPELPVCIDCDYTLTVFQTKPEEDESSYPDGELEICGSEYEDFDEDE